MYKTTTAYFKLNIKRYRTIIALYTFICFAAFPLLAIFEDSIHDASRWALDSSLILYGLFMVAVAFTLPIVLFRFGLNKRSVDTYYAFPISRSKLYISHYFSGLIVYIIPMILNFMIGCLILRFRFGPEYIAEAFTVFFATLIVSTTLYSINTLIVNKANNLIDALILCFAYLLLPFFIYLALNEFIGSHLVTLSASTLLNKTYIEYFLSPLTVMFQSLNSFANDYLNLPSGWVMYDLMFTVVFFIWGLHVFQK